MRNPTGPVGYFGRGHSLVLSYLIHTVASARCSSPVIAVLNRFNGIDIFD